MPDLALLTIGDELTSGRITDTNKGWIARELAALGVDTPLHLSCRDVIDEIVDALAYAHRRCAGVLTTGGLGPTDDDLTHEAVARYAGVDTVLDPNALATIAARFEAMGFAMPPSNERQAMLPEDCEIIPNPNGTAPGSLTEVGGKFVATMPGVPREMKAMVHDWVVPFLRARFGLSGVIRNRVLKTFGHTESRLGEIVGALAVPDENLRVGYRPTFPEIHLNLSATAPDEATADGWIADLEGQIRDALGPTVWGVDDETFPGVIGAALAGRGWRLALAESCTGGLVGKLVTDVPGSSAWFDRGYVTYSYPAKQDDLAVPAEILAPGGPGAVSEECVVAMARGALARSGADCALALSGVAGPDGGSEETPVGTVWTALGTPEGIAARRFRMPGRREWVRTLSAYLALERLRRHLAGIPEEAEGFGRTSAGAVTMHPR